MLKMYTTLQNFFAMFISALLLNLILSKNLKYQNSAGVTSPLVFGINKMRRATWNI